MRMPIQRTVALSTLLLLAGTAWAAEHGKDTGIYSPDKVQWMDGPKSIPTGAKMAVLEGDPSKAGSFVMRLKMPDGYKIAAHTHPAVEHVTVLSGNFFVVMGDDLDPKQASKMPAGSFGHWPAGMKHAAWVEGETVIQLHGVGPWAINYVNPADDPRNK